MKRWLTAVLTVVACTSEEPLCDRGEIEAALADAASGDRIELGACEVELNVQVPAGVTLAGQGTELTTVIAPRDSVTIELMADSATTTLRDLSVRARGRSGVIALGPGTAELQDVRVIVSAGAGISAVELNELVLRHVEVVGPVTEELADDSVFLHVVPSAVPTPEPESCSGEPSCEPGETRSASCTEGECSEITQVCDACGRWATVSAAYGVVLRNVQEEALLENVLIHQLALFGIVSIDSALTIRESEVQDNLGVGLYASGGTVELESTELSDTQQGLRGFPSFATFMQDVQLNARSIDMNRNGEGGGFGAALLQTNGVIEDLVASDNGGAALWLGNTTSFELVGSGTMLSANAFAAIVIVDSNNVRISDATVMETARQMRNIGQPGERTFGNVEVGDGIHLSGSFDSISLHDVSLIDNERVGALVHLGPEGQAPTFDNVRVSGTGRQLGAIAGTQSEGQLSPGDLGGWDQGIIREGSALTNDEAFNAALDLVRPSTPSEVPELPNVAAIVAPCD